MKYSFELSLASHGVDAQRDALHIEEVESKLPEQMLHSVILSGPEKKPYQLLFTGERVLDIERVNKAIGRTDLAIDMRFYPGDSFVDYGYSRIQPLIEAQGCETYLDESAVFKRRVHVATSNSTMGVWLKPSDLSRAYPGLNIRALSSEGESIGFSLDAKSEGDNSSDDESMRQLQKHVSRSGWSIRPIIFESSRSEVISMRASGQVEVDELAEFLEADHVLAAFFYELYFSMDGSKPTASLKDMIQAVGGQNALNYLSGLVLSEKRIDASAMHPFIGANTFRLQAKLGALLRDIIELARYKYPEACPNLAQTLGQMSVLPLTLWCSLVGEEGYQKYLKSLSLNPHRYPAELQKKVVGFNQNDVTRLILRIRKFPSTLQNALNNCMIPFYRGDDCFYANLMYIGMSYLSERGLISKALFAPMHKMHRFIAKDMDLLSEIGEALNRVSDKRELFNRLSWRFEPKTPKLIEVKCSKVDPEYFTYR